MSELKIPDHAKSRDSKTLFPFRLPHFLGSQTEHQWSVCVYIYMYQKFRCINITQYINRSANTKIHKFSTKKKDLKRREKALQNRLKNPNSPFGCWENGGKGEEKFKWTKRSNWAGWAELRFSRVGNHKEIKRIRKKNKSISFHFPTLSGHPNRTQILTNLTH